MNTFMDQLTSTNSTLAESILTEAARVEDCRKFFAKVDITYEFYGTNKDITVEYSGYFDSKSKTMMLETNKGLFILA